MPQEMNELPEELREMERLLEGVKPARARSRDRVLYEAGRGAGLRAGRRGRLAWTAACGALAAVCAFLILSPREKVVEHVVVQVPAASAAPNPSPQPMAVPVASRNSSPVTPQPNLTMDSLAMRKAVLRFSIDALREPAGGGGAAAIPALKAGDGLDSLPAWQKRAALSTGERS